MPPGAGLVRLRAGGDNRVRTKGERESIACRQSRLEGLGLELEQTPGVTRLAGRKDQKSSWCFLVPEEIPLALWVIGE
jgi:hypothetical protein